MASEEGPPISAVGAPAAVPPEAYPGSGFERPPERRPAPPPEPDARRQAVADAIADAVGVSRGRLVIEKNPVGEGFIYAIVDPSSGEVVRRWPDSEWVDIARRVAAPQGLLLDRTA